MTDGPKHLAGVVDFDVFGISYDAAYRQLARGPT